MAFFGQASRFSRPRYMSPGPATYRSWVGFDSFDWNPRDVRSPRFFEHKRLSVPRTKIFFRMSTSELLNESRNSSRGDLSGSRQRGDISSSTDKDNSKTVKQDAIMGELHSRMMHIAKLEANELHKDNNERETYLKERDDFYQQKLNECSHDKGNMGMSASDSILSGDIIVKVLRVASGRNLGPGVYASNSKDLAQDLTSYNIKGMKQFQELDKVGKKMSPARNKEREARRLAESFYESQKSSFIQMFQDDVKQASVPVSRRHSSFKVTPCKTGRYNTSMTDSSRTQHNRTAATARELKEGTRLDRKSMSTKNMEKVRQIIRETEKTGTIRHISETLPTEIERTQQISKGCNSTITPKTDPKERKSLAMCELQGDTQ